ncbi:hypothetical protein FGB62_169g310 [Gracilaria domingensis]|nr:hypothetical protein FGB62_169g310 [Gracilaria domingensis]
MIGLRNKQQEDVDSPLPESNAAWGETRNGVSDRGQYAEYDLQESLEDVVAIAKQEDVDVCCTLIEEAVSLETGSSDGESISETRNTTARVPGIVDERELPPFQSRVLFFEKLCMNDSVDEKLKLDIPTDELHCKTAAYTHKRIVHT